ncbi:GATA zinc finger domain-containing protein 15-like [Gordionus sp. m RMFG-2023]|uniref:GATA zinc finger domain-containing protein 15-like n=1 Tax=Gordionus sp. m RMFG-2023 TaxID=3053472 RepID=UPI0031FDE6FE
MKYDEHDKGMKSHVHRYQWKPRYDNCGNNFDSRHTNNYEPRYKNNYNPRVYDNDRGYNGPGPYNNFTRFNNKIDYNNNYNNYRYNNNDNYKYNEYNYRYDRHQNESRYNNNQNNNQSYNNRFDVNRMDDDDKANDYYKVMIYLNDLPIVMQINTGSRYSILPINIARKIGIKVLNKSDTKLTGYDGKRKEVLGIVKIKVRYEDKTQNLDAYVVQSDKIAILGRMWIKVFGNILNKFVKIIQENRKVDSKNYEGKWDDQYKQQINKQCSTHDVSTMMGNQRCFIKVVR